MSDDKMPDYSDPLPHLVGHFIYNIWGAPNQDNQHMIRPDRVTPNGGSINFIRVFKEDILLPTKDEYYHAYVIGQLSEYTINLPFYDWCDKTRWTNMTDYCKKSGLFFHFYTIKGVTVPLSHVYFTVTINNNIIFIIKEYKRLPFKMNDENITFRSYRNAMTLFGVGDRKETIDVCYKVVKSHNDRMFLNDFYRKYLDKPGCTFTYLNGFLIRDPISIRIEDNDIVEIVYDSSITKVIEMDINHLPTFDSIKDGIRKYLFTHDKSYFKNTLEYFDDCDFFLCIYPDETPTFFKGVTLHRNNEENIRQVTNCDFSISTNLVKEMIHEHNFMDQQLGNIVFRVYYRKQYREIKLPYVHNRLHELNKLPYIHRIGALNGVNATIPEWRADHLENSRLMELMSLDKPVCDIELVQDVYGYNGATWYTAKSVHPKKDFISEGNNEYYVNVPYSFRVLSTVFEYDVEGKLIEWNVITYTARYIVRNIETEYVEFISGNGSSMPQHYYGDGDDRFPVKSKRNEYRFYGCDVRYSSKKDNEITTWEEVTGLVNREFETDEETGKSSIYITEKYKTPSDSQPLYSFRDKKFIFRNNTDFLCREIEIDFIKGNLYFTLNQVYNDYSTNKTYEQAVKMPYGYLDLFLNDKALIENIDYFVDFPTVHIINKTCLDYTKDKQKILYRMYGFPDIEKVKNDKSKKIIRVVGTKQSSRQVGYVNNKVLSRNKIWDILDDKNLLIKVGNGIIAKEDLAFSEENGNVIVKRSEYLEGKPYEIQEISSSNTDAYTRDMYEFREEALDLDKRISDYMSKFFSDKKYESNPPIQGLYKIFSPFLSRLIWDFVHDQVFFEKIETRYLDEEVIDYIEKNYGDFFKIEPYFKLDEISLKHVTIHPVYKNTVTVIKYHQMRLLKRIIKIYYRNYIEVSHFVTVEKE